MSFASLLSEAHAAEAMPTTGDLLAVGLPFLRQLSALHGTGMVRNATGVGHLVYSGGELRFDPQMVKRPDPPNHRVNLINAPRSGWGFDVSSRAVNDPTDGSPADLASEVLLDPATLPERPLLVSGYAAWEQRLGHHDELTDIHIAGLLLTSYITVLDLDLPNDVNKLALNRNHLTRLNPALHPVVANVLSEMIDPKRHHRPPELSSAISRLENHRLLAADLNLDDAYRAARSDRTITWQTAVLSTLRDRVFDLSRRNRAIYFRPTAASVGLTEASVPMMLNIDRIRSGDVLTWNTETAAELTGGMARNLGKWCRFEEFPHIPPSLDRLIAADRKSRAEFGFGRLKLIVAFLHWVDPETLENVNSPLVFLSATLKRKRGIQTTYRLTCETEATVNPDLRHLLNARFGIELPTAIDASPASIRALVIDLERQVQESDPATRIELIEVPRIQLLRQRARVRLDAYRRRRVTALSNSGQWRRVDHSYTAEDWRPMGLALYNKFVRSPDLPLRSVTDGASHSEEREEPTMPTDRLGPLSFAAPGLPNHRSENPQAGSDTNRHRWEVDLCAVTLAPIGSKRTSLVRDYDELLRNPLIGHNHGPFIDVFSPEPRKADQSVDFPGIGTDQALVLPADDAQAKAVRRATAGESFIIQGPPGTGKSQTITNLIAALVTEGKRVLFVCEKRAAIDVVANRLRQVGLGELTATIHDSQADRRDFISGLGQVYDTWLDSDATDPAVKAADIRRRMQTELTRLQALETDLNASGMPGRKLVEQAAELRNSGVRPAHLIPGTHPSAGPATAPRAVPVADFLRALPGLNTVSEALGRSGRSSILGNEPALRIHPSHAADLDHVREAALLHLAQLKKLELAGIRLAEVSAGQLLELARDAAAIATIPAARGFLGSQQPPELVDAISQQRELRESLRAARAATERWSDPAFPYEEARVALAVATEQENSPFRLFNGRWRTVKAAVRARYDFAGHTVEPTISAVLTQLVNRFEAEAALQEFEQSSHRRWGTENPEALRNALEQVAGGPLVQFANTPGFDPGKISTHASQLGMLNAKLLIWPEGSLEELVGWANAAANTLPSVQPALELWAHLADFGPEVLLAALTPDSSLSSIELAIVDKGIEDLASRLSAVGMSGTGVEASITRLLEAQQELLAVNAASVTHAVRGRFLRNVEFTGVDLAGRPDGEKDFIASYKAGRRILENEFGKKMRHKPIRELASGDPGKVVADLAPIWLMSPLSVSETLPLDTSLFDAVVFDEASQIPVEDALPTMFRAPQVIVVGDRMQLPPTSFFAADTDDPEEDLVVDEDGHNLILSLTADSFLTQSDLRLRSTLLNWHYRSRSESLIAYSNTAFYGSQLATVPDRDFSSQERAAVHSAVPTQGREGAASVLDRPISFHRMTQAVYSERRNETEADYIAEMVRALLLGPTQLTMGIVAFSQAQQEEIEASLEELASADPRFATALDAETERSDGDEFVGLFVKNLENVQGDERDVIIMSVCYGPDETGRIRMNFGPINQQGGERRLNVIFSRARRHMAVVSSIDGSQITNLHNPGAANLAQFLSYAAAESVGNSFAARSALAKIPGAQESRPSEKEVSPLTAEIATALQQAGLSLDLDVGRSSFKIDLAVRGADQYVIGILIEPASESARTGPSRYVAESGVLAAFGWPIVRISITEWIENPSAVVQRIVQLAHNQPS